MVVKLDMVINIFDHVHDSFLLQVMGRFVFIPSFIRWVASSIGNLWISPLVNGRPSCFFQTSRGLRQGFQLFSLLFITVSEYLRENLEEERELGILSGLLP
jgi:hypothetical protein